MQSGMRGFPDRVETGEIAQAVEIDLDAAAGVMRRRNDRNRLAGNVDSEFQASRMDGREMFLDKGERLMGDVKIDAIQAAFFHFEVNGTGHNVTRRKFGACVVRGHEAGTVGQSQDAAFTAHGFRNQKRLRMRVIQAGGMELDELHVGNAAAGTPAHGNAIPGGGVRIGGVQIDLARASGGKHHMVGSDRFHAAACFVQTIQAKTPVAGQAQFARGNQVHRHMVFQNRDVRVRLDLGFESGLDCMASRVGGMNHSPVAMPAFAGQVIAHVSRGVTGEGYSLADQPFDCLTTVLDHVSGDFGFAQSGAGSFGIADVVGGTVVVGEHGGNATLRPV